MVNESRLNVEVGAQKTENLGIQIQRFTIRNW